MFFLYAFILIGPNLAKVPDVKPFDNALATNAPANVAVILVLLAIALLSNVLNAPLKFPCNILSTALLAPVDCAKLSAVPASIAEILNDFLALRRGALRLGAMLHNLRLYT